MRGRMDYDKSSSSIVLDVAWGNVDKKNQGFIYAKNFPQLIHAIELVLNRGEPAKELRLLSNTGKNVIDTFAREKEFFKIYKDEFKEIFQGLVGQTFKDAVEGTFPAGKVPSNILQEEFEEVKGPESPRRRELRLKSLENRLAALTEELQFKDDVIAEKDRELINLTRSLSAYKDKYDFLQRQFSFYKDRGETPGGRNNSGEGPEVAESASTRHEFIISEMKRKLQEQLLTINTLREQMQQNRGAYIWHGKPASHPKVEILMLSIITVVMVVLLTLLGRTVYSSIASSEDGLYADSFRWDNSGILSKLGWFWQDWKENLAEETSSGAYDRIFGLADYT